MSSLPAICTELAMRACEGVPVVSSRDIAETFDKRHADVLRDIDVILSGSSLNADLRSVPWFVETSYTDPTGRTLRSFDLTRQGFTLLVMGWTGEKAMAFKVRYIQAFDAMEEALKVRAPESDFILAVREIVAPLAVRFSGQDQAISRIEARVDSVADDVRFLKNVIGGKRRNLSAETKREHVSAVIEMGGNCPCCRTARIVIDGEKSAFSQFDHFYQNSHANADETWLICAPCHNSLTTGNVARHEREPEFKAYQQARRRLPGRQARLF